MKNLQETIAVIKKSSRDYPKILLEIHNAPKQLFVRGSLPKDHSLNFAIVGTRAASDYGRTLAFKIAQELAELGFNIVSGLALGVDTESHLGALEGKNRAGARAGNTIAVLGSSIDDNSIYPSANFKLAKKIISSGGAVISEYEPGTKSEIWFFPNATGLYRACRAGFWLLKRRKNPAL